LEQTKTMNTKATTHTKKFFDTKNISCLSSPYLNKGNDSYKNINYNYDSKGSKYMNNTEGFKNIKIPENTKIHLRNKILDLELLKLPSIGPDEPNTVQKETGISNIGNCKTGKSYIPAKQALHSGSSMAKQKTNATKDENRLHYNAMLNKTRIDNLPPLQELSVFEQSFESKRKQTQPVLRSRSKNIRNFETGSYINGTGGDPNIVIEDNAMRFDYQDRRDYDDTTQSNYFRY
jgi:hypothetical protein